MRPESSFLPGIGTPGSHISKKYRQYGCSTVCHAMLHMISSRQSIEANSWERSGVHESAGGGATAYAVPWPSAGTIRVADQRCGGNGAPDIAIDSALCSHELLVLLLSLPHRKTRAGYLPDPVGHACALDSVLE